MGFFFYGKLPYSMCFSMLLFISFNAAAFENCTDKMLPSLGGINEIKGVNQLTKVTVGLDKMGGKKEIGFIVSSGEKCDLILVLKSGKQYSDLRGYKPTGAKVCSLDEVLVKASKLLQNANEDLNNWVPKGTIMNNPDHFLKRWNLDSKLCSNLTATKAEGCTGTCKVMYEESGRKVFCENVLPNVLQIDPNTQCRSCCN